MLTSFLVFSPKLLKLVRLEFEFFSKGAKLFLDQGVVLLFFL